MAAHVVEVQAPPAGASPAAFFFLVIVRLHRSSASSWRPTTCTPATFATIIFAPPQAGSPLSTRDEFIGPFVYGCPPPPEHGESEARISARTRTSRPSASRFLCRGRFGYEFWGLRRHGNVPPGLPGGGRHALRASAPTAWAATCCRASSTARASRSPSGSSASPSASRSASSSAASPAITVASSTSSSSSDHRDPAVLSRTFRYGWPCPPSCP